MTEHKKPHSLMQADEYVATWARQTLETDNISLAAPESDTGVSEAYLYLLELADAPPLRGPGRVPLQVQARYLVTVPHTDPITAHSQLNTLLFAAMSHPLFETDFAISPTLWTALKIIPQPAFMLAVPIVVEQPTPDIPIVREPPTIDSAPMMILQGILLGPGEIPLANARVDYPSLERTSTTNAQGKFNLRAVPVEPRSKVLQVRTKGKLFDLTVDLSDAENEEIILHVPLLD